jgi:RNA polymerase sigma-70 factor, ECF subfamily
MNADAHGLVDHLFRERSGQMVAWLTRIFGPAHIELVEEVVQDALVKALQQWPFTGVPHNPAGWLVQVARNRALDVLRRHASFRERADEIARELTRSSIAPPLDQSRSDGRLADDELQMMFLCCHPSLSRDAQVALSLKTVGGFGVQEIARAMLTPEATIAQRLVRAKRQLRATNARFELPSADDLSSRLDAVLEVIYLLFNEGYAAREGDSLIRTDICGEALRLARVVAGSAVGTPSAHALAALLAFQSARLPARVDASGDVVLLDEQDRSTWDQRSIALGFAHLERSAAGEVMSPYHLQAAIAAAHAGAARMEDTRWDVILRLYDDLLTINPSPLVALNRIVAVWRVRGLDAAERELRAVEETRPLRSYYLLPALRGRLLAARGEQEAARRAFDAALELPCSEPEKRLLQRLRDRVGSPVTDAAARLTHPAWPDVGSRRSQKSR